MITNPSAFRSQRGGAPSMQQMAQDRLDDLSRRGVLGPNGQPASTVFQQNFGAQGMHTLMRDKMLAEGTPPELVPFFRPNPNSNQAIFGTQGGGARTQQDGPFQGNKGPVRPAAAQPGWGPGTPDRGAPAPPSSGIFGLNANGSISLPQNVRNARGGRRQERQMNQNIRQSLRPRNQRRNPGSVEIMPFR